MDSHTDSLALPSSNRTTALQSAACLRPRLPVQTAPPLIFRPLFSAKSPPCLPLLTVVSGILATAPHLLQKVSSLRPAKAAGSPVCAPLLPVAPASAQNQAFSVVRVFSVQVYSRGLFKAALSSISARDHEKHSNPYFSPTTSPQSRFSGRGAACRAPSLPGRSAQSAVLSS